MCIAIMQTCAWDMYLVIQSDLLLIYLPRARTIKYYVTSIPMTYFLVDDPMSDMK